MKTPSLRFLFSMLLLINTSFCWSANSNNSTDHLPSADGSARARLIGDLERALSTNYVYPELALKMANAIHSHEQNGDYEKITDPTEFTEALNRDLQAVSHDLHVKVRYSEKAIPMPSDTESISPPDPAVEQARRKYMQAENYGFEKYEHLSANLAYLDIRGFFPADEGGATASAVMTMVANADGLIIDLRNNSGGDPAMVALIASYLFGGESVHLDSIYQREGNQTTQFWTAPFVSGGRYGKVKPIYVLTSKNTFSAGEALAYDLQALKRAIVVGEVTKGGANPGRWVHLDQHFACLIPTGRAVNPITGTNWEGVGVHPDVEVSADLALKTAELLAMKPLLKNITDDEERDLAEQAVSKLEAELIKVGPK